MSFSQQIPQVYVDIRDYLCVVTIGIFRGRWFRNGAASSCSRVARKSELLDAVAVFPSSLQSENKSVPGRSVSLSVYPQEEPENAVKVRKPSAIR